MFTLNCRGRLLVLDKPVVMGIINATPDSFYAGSRYQSNDAILEQAGQMLSEGAAIIDIGGQSTRPGSDVVPVAVELERVIEAIRIIHTHYPTAIISIDTYYGEVAAAAVQAGASIVNDISAGSIDPTMIPTVAALKTPYVLMHMPGTPQTMQQNTVYEQLVPDIMDFMVKKIGMLREAGIQDLVIDPGFGFGKTISQNFELLRQLPVFGLLDAPVLLGISRKSTIYKTLGIPAEESLNGTTVLNTIGLMNGAMILRVHDVKQAVEAVRLYTACMEPAIQKLS